MHLAPSGRELARKRLKEQTCSFHFVFVTKRKQLLYAVLLFIIFEKLVKVAREHSVIKLPYLISSPAVKSFKLTV